MVALHAALAVLLGAGSALAIDEPRATVLSCTPGTGIWSAVEGGGWRLDAALCTPTAHADEADEPCAEFVGFEIAADGTASPARIATTPASFDTCNLEWVMGLGRTAYYRDGERVLMVDADSLEIRGLTELPAGRIEPAPGGRLALWTEGRILLLTDGGAQGPTVEREIATKDPITLEWWPDRLILVEEQALRWWMRDPATGALVDDGQRNAFAQPMGDAIWALDERGLVRSIRERERVGWYRFTPDSSFHFSLNSSGRVEGIAGAPDLAVFVSEGGDAKAYARTGGLGYYKRRYEQRYWRLTDAGASFDAATSPPLALRGEDERLVLAEGYTAERAAVVDVGDMTWRRVAVLEFAAPGQLVSLEGTTLLTMHPGRAATPLVTWDIRSAETLSKVDRAALQAAGLDELVSIERLAGEGDARWLLRDKQGRVAVYHTATSKVTGVGAGAGKVLDEIVWLDEQLVATAVDGDGHVASWHLVPTTPAGESVVATVPGELTDAMDTTARWFDYCVEGLPCQRTVPAVERSGGSVEHWRNVTTRVVQTRPVELALAFLGGSLLLLVGTVIWRTDVGRRGRVSQQPGLDDDAVLDSVMIESSALDLGSTGAVIDGRGRRYITGRDTEGFVHHGWTHLPWRLGLALGAGGAVAIPTGFVWLVKEPLGVSLPYWLALWIPVSVLVFVLLSWPVWNRMHLLRFGHAYKGVWYDSGTSRASLCYTLPNGTTWRLKRGQWKRADLVPVVLVDPSRPRRAAQYTGNGQFPVAQLDIDGRLRGTAVVKDGLRLLLVTLLCAGAVAGSIYAFLQAFPEPLSSWTMATIEAEAEQAETPMLGPCLAACEERRDGAECFRQCQSRQMRRVFEAGGIEVDGDPDLMPNEFRARQLEHVEQVARLIDEASVGTSCDALASSIDAVPRWTPGLERAFTSIYDGELRDSDESLAGLEARIASIGESSFWPLCAPPPACLDGSASCPEPPPCTGRVTALRESLCGFAEAMAPRVATVTSADAGGPSRH